ncbi:DUF4810 domain-containing protein [Roseateles amylovorans]|uniref:DUF4810 domain-containing protein n=1 Tax=Roseateles amylovorans TaxID=2978473 RepID=A0ABY6B1A1_9BURK|nr:DUF4810 domain-containing protein [Roseateles amylovorans]UXH78820.1 DUF4810 domain-containing protein [Roseateles amylovorans]
MMIQKTLRVIALAAAAALLAACGTPQKPLYQWSGYQSGLYDYFKTNGTNAGDQITQLESQLIKNKAANEATPPGLHGHLALLYAKVGNDDAARAHLEAERALFPESAGYVDFLLKKSSPKTAAVAASGV